MILVAALAALLAGAALVPAVQTWIARDVLAGHGMNGKLGSLSAGFGRMDVTGLEVGVAGGTLRVPSLMAELPLASALWNRNAKVGRLEARGWTLDLSRRAGPAGVTGQPGSSEGEGASPRGVEGARAAAGAFGALLGNGTLPLLVSLDGVELEGDVLLDIAGQRAPVPVHVVIKGGGLAAGHEGSFSLDATAVVADSEIAANAVDAHGRLVLGMSAQRGLERIRIDVGVSDTGGRIPAGQALSAGVSRGVRPGDRDIALELSRGGRRLASIAVRYEGAGQALGGSWKLDLADSDLAIATRTLSLPRFSVAGDGRLDTDLSLGRVHALGRVHGAVGHLGALNPQLEALGSLDFDAEFDVAHEGHSLRVGRLQVSAGGPPSHAAMGSRQAFSLDEASGSVTADDPANDLMELSFVDFPMDWLSGPDHPLVVGKGRATGSLSVRASGKGIALATRSPLKARDVAVSWAGVALGSGLDLSASARADWSGAAWTVRLDPLVAEHSGHPVGTLTASASRPAGTSQPISVSAAWEADLDALAAGAASGAATGLTARSASGEFTASVGDTTKVDGKISVVGHDKGHKVDASLHAEVFGDGTVEFRLPSRVIVGAAPSDVSLDGTWTPGEPDAQVGMELSGTQVSLEHLRLIAAELGLLGSRTGSRETPAPSAGAPAPAAAWGGRKGSVRVVIDRLTGEGEEFKDVRGTIEFERSAILLKKGRCTLAHHTLENIEGALVFDPSAGAPYTLTAKASPYQVDAAALFNPPPKGQDPEVEGHFTVSAALEGHGARIGDLLDNTTVRYVLKSTGGIFRALRTDVADAIPETPTPVSDTLGTVGSAVGSIFGLKSDLGSRNPLNKAAEAVLQFTNNVSEIGFDAASLVATEGPDHAIDLSEISLTAPDERLSGSGHISHAEGVPPQDQKLSLDLQVGVRGKLAELMATAGLLSPRKDADGYAMILQPAHFGGTLRNLDRTQWHDLLARAATAQPGKVKGTQ